MAEAPVAEAHFDLGELAATLDEAARSAKETAQLPATLTLEEAYEVQRRAVALRHRRGESRLGVKVGFTSTAKMAQMGVHTQIWGRLTDAMLVDDGGTLELARFVHPRVEPEVCFLLERPLEGRVSGLAAMSAVAGVAPAMEIIDSRYRDFRFSLPDVVADNASSAGVVVGPWSDPGTDLSNLGMVMEVDGEPVQIGSSAAILGHPLRSLVAAAALARRSGERLEEGDIVMAGGATEAVALRAGNRVRLEVERLGRVSFKVEG